MTDTAIRPGTPMRLTILQTLILCTVLAGGGYSVGRVHAQLDSHEALEGHGPLEKRVRLNEQTMAKIAAVLALLQQRK